MTREDGPHQPVEAETEGEVDDVDNDQLAGQGIPREDARDARRGTGRDGRPTGFPGEDRGRDGGHHRQQPEQEEGDPPP
jgi:hypothetical protein